MSLKAFSPILSAFVGGVVTWGGEHWTTDHPTDSAQGKAFLVGAIVAGVSAALHLWMMPPGKQVA
jgi:hypothetical protein